MAVRARRVARGAAAGCAAMAVALLLTGCDSDPEPDPIREDAGSTPYTPPVSTTQQRALNLVLSEGWMPDATACQSDEYELVQPLELARSVRICRPASSTAAGYMRIVNISDTSLVFNVNPVRPPEWFFPPDETALTMAALRELSLTGSYDESTGELRLPARFTAVVVDGWAMKTVPVREDAEHAKLVTQARVMSDLTAQLPYAKLAELPQTPAKVAACVLDSAQAANDGAVTLEEAVNSAETCGELANHLNEKWEASRNAEVAAGRVPPIDLPAPSPEEFLRGLSRGTQPVESSWDELGRALLKGVSRVHK